MQSFSSVSQASDWLIQFFTASQALDATRLVKLEDEPQPARGSGHRLKDGPSRIANESQVAGKDPWEGHSPRASNRV